jgi:hypothetical protein
VANASIIIAQCAKKKMPVALFLRWPGAFGETMSLLLPPFTIFSREGFHQFMVHDGLIDLNTSFLR